MDKSNSVETNMALMAEKISSIEKTTSAIQTTLETVLKNYVQRDEFETRFARLQAEVDKRFEGTHSRINESITEKHCLEILKPLQDDISQLQDDKTWLYRLVIGIIVTALIGLVVTIK